MDFNKYSCPLCGQAFNDTDDVVVCPDCGTPHHRECWFNNGKCANSERHGIKEPIEVEFKQVETEENIDNSTENGIEKNDENTSGNAQVFGYFGNTNFNENQGKEPPQKIVQDIMDRLSNNSQEEVVIDNHKLSFFAAAIGKNQEYYLPRFMLFEKVKKAFSWNIAGFFVPLAWTLYRKMYKLSALIFAVYMVIFSISAVPLIGNEEYLNATQECLQEDPQYATKILAYQTGSTDVTLTAKQAELYEIMEKIEIPVYIQVITYILTIGLRIAMGVFGTYLYFKKLSKNISKAKEKARITGTTDEALKMLLYKKYGTLPIIICAIVGFLEFQIF
ncbi:MAG: DUF2628 domain-containing protein [Clostridia bacterium]|nr:DUF2628 domain-containing protein [Clostridia bacterium]